MTTLIEEHSTRASSRPGDQLDPGIMDDLKLSAAKRLRFLHRPIDIRPDIDCESCPSDEDDLNRLISFCKIDPESHLQRRAVVERTDLSTRTSIQSEYRVANAKTMVFPVVDDDLLDWDARIETPPPRRSGKISVKLQYRGRSKPIPVDDL